MGTPELAARALLGLYEDGYELSLVVTQPDKQKGRGNKLEFSPVKALAIDKGLDIIQPTSLRDPAVIRQIRDAEPDAIIVAAYGKLLPKEILELPPLGCINIHASILPAYRGASPIQWALINGESETGVTIMKMDEGLDTGPILSREKMEIPDNMDFGGLYAALSEMGARLLSDVLLGLTEHTIMPEEQTEEGASYAGRLDRKDEAIDWGQPAVAVRNRIRAFAPSPGAYASIGGKEIKVLKAEVLQEGEEGAFPVLLQGEQTPGQIIGVVRKSGPVVACGDGYLLLSAVQPAGKKPMEGWAWLNGSRLAQGQSFDLILV
jgi:methionyl-tRNA formyltransferase